MKPVRIQLLTYVKVLCALFLIGMGYQNCAQSNSEGESATTLEKVLEDAGFQSRIAGDDIRVEEGIVCTERSLLRFQFSFTCSNSLSEARGSNLATANEIKIVILDKATGVKACEISGDLRLEIVTTKSLSINACPNLGEGSYLAYIIDAESTSSDIMKTALNTKGINFSVDKTGGVCARLGKGIELVYDSSAGSTAGSQKKCDRILH